MNKDCFGYSPNTHKCVVLDKTYCKKEKCPFYKSVRQMAEEQEKMDLRMFRLGSVTREELMKRYKPDLIALYEE